MIITRFAPSPTGGLHIGSVRTILFNWLYARHHAGQFLLRIEDTDVARSKKEYVEDIYRTLKWLNLDWDGEVVFQLQNIERHQEIAYNLLQEGKAYKCYCTQEELEAARTLAVKEGRTPRYERVCRDLNHSLVNKNDKPFVIRLKTPIEGTTEFVDLIQGHCKVENANMDDMVLLRSDGTPTYMLAVVVDDHDMTITHVIRASEHLNNTYRQKQIYNACNWFTPEFAHVSLIHGEDGAKLSKRHGAVTIDEYKDQGILKEAMLNYLMRLGWSKGSEIISVEEAIKLFDIADVRSSAAQFSHTKLLSVNSIYMRQKDNSDLLKDLKNFVGIDKFSAQGWARILLAMDELKARVRTMDELAKMANIFGNDGSYFASISASQHKIDFIKSLIEDLSWSDYTIDDVKKWLDDHIQKHSMTLKEVAPELRLALTKEKVAPGIFELISILGSQITRERLSNAIKAI